MQEILIENNKDFNIEQICECGQLFRYKKIENGYIIYETDQKVVVIAHKTPIIYTNNPKRTHFYFDLQNDYAKIKLRLRKQNAFLKTAISFGEGIRILKQDLIETIISFIISANNNIPRIQKTIEKICESFGKNMGDYYAFPTLTELSKITEQDFKSFGAGYRSSQLVKTINTLSQTDFLELVKTKNTADARKMLITLSGVGPKVADCILLFGLGKTDVFPADTWIKKMYEENFGGKTDEKTDKVSKFFTDKFGEDSGIAQQYLYSYKRNIEKRRNKNGI